MTPTNTRAAASLTAEGGPKTSFKIAVIGGDGTGPEVIHEGIKVLNAAARKFKFKVDWVNYDLGGERYKKSGEILPDSALTELRKMDAIYLGADTMIEAPRPGQLVRISQVRPGMVAVRY